MCGPTKEEKSLEAQQASFSQQLQTDYAQRYGSQTADLNNLNNTLTPIMEAGPDQQGFSPQELAAQNTQAINSTGANYANAARALNGQLAGRGGGGVGLTSGVDAQLKAQLAGSAAGALSNEQLGITNANYATGRQNFENATAGVNALAGLTNPTPYASEGNQANQGAFGEASTIEQQQAQADAAIFGDITGVASTVLSGGLSNMSKDSTAGENVGNFFSGGLGALAGA